MIKDFETFIRIRIKRLEEEESIFLVLITLLLYVIVIKALL